MPNNFTDTIQEKFDAYQQKMASTPEWFQALFGGDSIFDMVFNNGLQTAGVAVTGWLITTYFERRHITKLTEQETQLAHIRLSNTDKFDETVSEGIILIGSTVLVHDIFRKLIITIKKIIGGNVRLYERLTMRGRREAIIRLKEEAQLRGLDQIINIRLTTVKISGRFLSGIAMIAYGTGVKNNTKNH